MRYWKHRYMLTHTHTHTHTHRFSVIIIFGKRIVCNWPICKCGDGDYEVLFLFQVL